MSGDATEKNKIIIIKVKQRREDLQLPESQPLFIYSQQRLVQVEIINKTWKNRLP